MRSCLLLLSALLLISCTEKVDMGLKEGEEKVVIEAVISTDINESRIVVSKTAPYFSGTEQEFIKDAYVEVSNDSGSWVFEFNPLGFYRLESRLFQAKKGMMYRLKVIAEGKEYTARSYLHPCVLVDSNLTFEFRKEDWYFGYDGYATIIKFTDNRTEEVYTELTFSNWSYDPQKIRLSNLTIPRNQQIQLELPFFRSVAGDDVRLTFRSMDREVAEYFNALEMLNDSIPGPFRSPPANPPTNITGGALGYFLATDEIYVHHIIR